MGSPRKKKQESTEMSRDTASDQLKHYKQTKGKKGQLTTGHGAPIGDKVNSITAGPRGPVLIQDHVLIEELAHFDRERIPERVVHAKGAGAFGYFKVTHDITKYCKANLFGKVGRKTDVAVRFSTVGGESGSADTARDPRGFSVKFYTKEGNWDLVGNNTPIFFVRDPLLFPSFIHSQKRNPVTHLKDPDAFWDFISLNPMTTHQVSFLFSERGTPDGYRHMNGYGSHTFKLVNDDNEAVYCKFHFKTDQGIKNFTDEEAAEMAMVDPDYAIRDLYNSISSGDFPTWSMFLQVMTFKEAEECPFNPFDLTKVWSQQEYKLIPVGKLVLNQNPDNYFAQVEQIAFSPAHLVPGIETSPDKMLQGRLFSYNDTHRHRLGANWDQIPVNCPLRAGARNYQRDGPMTVSGNQEGAPNYFPNSFSGPNVNKKWTPHSEHVPGDVARWNSADEDNFTQAGIFYNKTLNEAERFRLADNIASHLCNAQGFIQERAIKNFASADAEFGRKIRELIDTKYSSKPESASGAVQASL